jgi:Fe-S-cluster formation regulator IscX/YfhJ
LRLTKFDPKRHDVVLDPRTVGDTPLDASIWEDEDFEDEEDYQVEEAVEAVERAKKQAAMEHWAKDYVDRAFETHKRNQAARNPDQPAAEVTTTGSAVVSSSRAEKPVVEKKKPASHIDMSDVRQQVRAQIRKDLFASGVPASSTPPK